MVPMLLTIPSEVYEIKVEGETHRYIKLNVNGAVEVEQPGKIWKDKLVFSEFIQDPDVAEAIAKREKKRVYPSMDEVTKKAWVWKVR